MMLYVQPGRQRETTYSSCKLTLTFGFRVDALPHGRGLKHRAEAGEAESPVVAALAVLGRGVKDACGRDAVRLVALQLCCPIYPSSRPCSREMSVSSPTTRKAPPAAGEEADPSYRPFLPAGEWSSTDDMTSGRVDVGQWCAVWQRLPPASQKNASCR